MGGVAAKPANDATSKMERAFELLHQASASASDANGQDAAARQYRQAVALMADVATNECDVSVRDLILENVELYRKKAEAIESRRAPQRSPPAESALASPSPPRSPLRPPLRSPPTLSRFARQPVESAAPREHPSSTRRLVRSPSKLALEFSAGTTLCCCGAVQKNRLESIYELCIKPVKEGYPSCLLRSLGWGLIMTQILVLTSYLYEVGHSCSPADGDSSSTVFWGIPLCCIYAASDSLKSLFRFLPLTLYAEDPLVTRQAVCMAIMVLVLALYQMYAIGLVMSQEPDIVNLISDFVGVTIVTKSNELIADILELEDADPYFIRNLAVRARLRELAEENAAAAAAEAAAVEAAAGDVEESAPAVYQSPARRGAAMVASAATALATAAEAVVSGVTAMSPSKPPCATPPMTPVAAAAGAKTDLAWVRQKVRTGKRFFLSRMAQRLGRSYKNPLKRLNWIAGAAIAIGVVTYTGRKYRYFCVGEYDGTKY